MFVVYSVGSCRQMQQLGNKELQLCQRMLQLRMLNVFSAAPLTSLLCSYPVIHNTARVVDTAMVVHHPTLCSAAAAISASTP